jgi:hypothetical protein
MEAHKNGIILHNPMELLHGKEMLKKRVVKRLALIQMKYALDGS